MTIAPAILRPTKLPGLAIVCLVLVVFLLAQTALMALMGMWSMVILSLVTAAVFALGAWYYITQARLSAVMIDGASVTIKTPAGQETIPRDEIDSVDLSSTGDQLLMRDGTTAYLPLEGDELLQAALLLDPRTGDQTEADANIGP